MIVQFVSRDGYTRDVPVRDYIAGFALDEWVARDTIVAAYIYVPMARLRARINQRSFPITLRGGDSLSIDFSAGL